MQNDTNVLPEGFDGVFRFTNFTGNDFTTRWNSVEYTFPAMKTVPLIIPNASPEEVQNIRKKFARDLATAVFYESDKFKSMDLSVADSQAGKIPALYTDKDIEPYIQRCLEALPPASAKVEAVPKPEIRTRTDNEGNPVTQVLDGNKSLVGNGQVVA